MANLPTNQAATTLDLGGDLTVRRLGFGAMRITGRGIWGEPADRDEAIATLRRAVELGVNFVDTADSYGPFVSERLIAEALHPYAEDLVIATKGGMTRSGPSRWGTDGRPQHLRAACDESLQRLRLEQIPMYQFHRPDPTVPFEDSVGMLAELKDEGKVRHIGLSNVTETHLDQAMRRGRGGAPLHLGASSTCRRFHRRGVGDDWRVGRTLRGHGRRAGVGARPGSDDRSAARPCARVEPRHGRTIRRRNRSDRRVCKR
jgi:Aldo/keto reductase family